MAPAATFKKFKKIFSPIALAMLFAKAILFSDLLLTSNFDEDDFFREFASAYVPLRRYYGARPKHTTPQRCCSQSLPGT